MFKLFLQLAVMGVQIFFFLSESLRVS